MDTEGLDTSLEEYLWEAAAAVIKQEQYLEEPQDYPDWDLTMQHWPDTFKAEELSPEQQFSPEMYMTQHLLPDGTIPSFMETVLADQELLNWEEEDLKNDGIPMLCEQDPFIGWEEELEPQTQDWMELVEEALLEVKWEDLSPRSHRPRSVAFVGPKGSLISTSSIDTTNVDISATHNGLPTHFPVSHPPHIHQLNSSLLETPHYSLDYSHQPHIQLPVWTSTASTFLPDSHAQLPSTSAYEYAPMETSTDDSSMGYTLSEETSQSIYYQHPQYHQHPHYQHVRHLEEEVQYIDGIQSTPLVPYAESLISVPESIVSSHHSDGTWSTHDSYSTNEERAYSSLTSSPSSSMSQDDILEEIRAECAQIEERHSSASPPTLEQFSAKSLASSSKSKRKSKHDTERKLHATSSTTKSKRKSTSAASPPVAPSEKKKELNRIAATKYREKKRMEKESTTTVLRDLESRNLELKSEFSAIQTEILYLKGLIKEIESRKGSKS